jgi:hypothetical protein
LIIGAKFSGAQAQVLNSRNQVQVNLQMQIHQVMTRFGLGSHLKRRMRNLILGLAPDELGKLFKVAIMPILTKT